MGKYYFAKRLIEFLPLLESQAKSSDVIIDYVSKYEDYLSRQQIKNWLKLYSRRPASILKVTNENNFYFLKTKKLRHKVLPEEILVNNKKSYSCLEDFSLRDQKIITLHSKGLTLQEIGDAHSLTRERVRQILKPAKAIGIVKGRIRKKRLSDKGRLSMKLKGFSSRGLRQKYPERNAKIEKMIIGGLTYSQVANELEISRSTVATVMYRIKHRKDNP